MRPVVNFDGLEIVSVITSFQAIDLSVFDETVNTEEQGQP